MTRASWRCLYPLGEDHCKQIQVEARVRNWVVHRKTAPTHLSVVSVEEIGCGIIRGPLRNEGERGPATDQAAQRARLPASGSGSSKTAKTALRFRIVPPTGNLGAGGSLTQTMSTDHPMGADHLGADHEILAADGQSRAGP